MFFSTPSRPTCQTPNSSADQTVPPYGGYSPSLHEAFAPPASVYQQPDQALMDTSSAAAGTSSGQPLYQSSPYGLQMRGGSGNAVAATAGPYTSDDWGLAARGSVIMVPSKPVENRRKGGRKPKNDKLPPEEEEKRRVRRERNKVAAAKCRQRRVDHTNCLLQETQELEDHEARMTQEVKRLQQMKEHLEQVLRAHRMHCALDGAAAVGVSSGHRIAAAASGAPGSSALMLGGGSGGCSSGGGSTLVAGMHAPAAAHAHHHQKAAAAAMGLCGGMGMSGLQATACGTVHRQSSGSDSSQEQGSSPGGRHHHALLSL